MQDWIYRESLISENDFFLENSITAGLFLPDKDKVILGYEEGTVKILNIDFRRKETQKLFSFQFENKDSVRTITRYKNHNIIFIGTLNSGNFKLFDIDKNEVLKEEKGIYDKYNRIFRSEWLNDKCYIIGSTFGGLNAFKINGDIQKQRIKTSGSNSTFGISCLDEKEITSGEYLGSIRMWTYEDSKFKLKKSIIGYRETIQAVSWQKSGEYFTTLGKEGTIQIYKKYIKDSEENWILYLIYFSGSGIGNFINFSNDQSKVYAITSSDILIIDINTSGIFRYSIGGCLGLYEIDEQFLIIHREGVFFTKIEEPTLQLHEKLNFIKVSIIGDTETGKSTLCSAIIKDSYDPTLKSTKMRTIWDWDIDEDPPLKIVFHDFGGQQNILPAHFPHLIDSDLILITFSQRDVKTLEIAIDLRDILRDEYEYKKDIIFVRTKCDQEDNISEFFNDYNQLHPEKNIIPIETRISDDLKSFIGAEKVRSEILNKMENLKPKGMLISNETKKLLEIIEAEQDKGTERITYSDVYDKLKEDNDYINKKKLFFTLKSLAVQGRLELKKRKEREKIKIFLSKSGYKYDIYINMKRIFDIKNKILQKAYSNEGVFNWNAYIAQFEDDERDYNDIIIEMLELDNLCIDHGNQKLFLFFIKDSLGEQDKILMESKGIRFNDEDLLFVKEFDKILYPKPEDWIPYFLELNLTILKISKSGGIFYYTGLNAYCYISLETDTNIMSQIGKFSVYIGGESPEIREKLKNGIIEIYYKLFNEEVDENHSNNSNDNSNSSNNSINLINNSSSTLEKRLSSKTNGKILEEANKEDDNKKINFFLAYDTDDLPIGGSIVEMIEEMSFKVNNSIELKLGDNLIEIIKKGISENDFGLILISENFLNKNWKKNELKFITNLKKTKGKILFIFYNIDETLISQYNKSFLNSMKNIYDSIDSLSNILKSDIIEMIIENYNELSYNNRENLIENLRFKNVDKNILESLKSSINLIIFTSVDVERLAILNSMKPLMGEALILRGFVGAHTYYIGTIGKYNMVLTKTGPGTSQRNGSLISCEHAFNYWSPKATIACGIAFGINKKKRKIGDVLISKHIIPYEIQRIGERIIHRGGIPASSAILYDRFVNAIDWKFSLGYKIFSKIREGDILSGEKLIDDENYLNELTEQFPEAIGGEMEGTGLYVSADNNRIDWIIIKSICDWGYDKRKDFQVLAANASASLVHFVLNNPNSLSDLGISSINNNTC